MFCDLSVVNTLDNIREEKIEYHANRHLKSVGRIKNRRAKLLDLIKKNYSDKKGAAILFSGFKGGVNEDEFVAESSFYYLTDVDYLKNKNTQASVLMLNVIDSPSQSTLYVPLCSRYKKYYDGYLDPGEVKASYLGLDDFLFTGDEPNSIRVPQFFEERKYGNVISKIKEIINSGGAIFCLYPENVDEEDTYEDSKNFWRHLSEFIPRLKPSILDISPLLASMRRKKDSYEIEQLKMAVQFSMEAHRAVARTIAYGKRENMIRGKLEKIYYSKELRRTSPPIVSSGENSCFLHHIASESLMKSGDLVIIDTGAQYEHYCGDITITYPVSGKFSKRQKKIYNIVLAAHEYIRDIAKPGFYLDNAECQEKSLNHLHEQFLKKHGHKKEHGIGHFLGLDVHDVGDLSAPLQVGDVFTIEPGIYLKEGPIGIRIEDDYVMEEDGPVSLSGYPKRPEDIEAMMKKELK